MSDDDPFENLDPPEDREGDPFERLGPASEADDEPADTDGDRDDGTTEGGPADRREDRSDTTATSADDSEPSFWDEMREADRVGADTGSESTTGIDTGSESAAGTDRAADVEPETVDDGAESESSGDDADQFEETFIEGDTVGAGDTTAGVDEDDPFAGIGDRGGDPFGEGESAFEQVDVEELNSEELWALLEEDPDGSPSAINHPVEVSKHRFCEQCEFFSGPPNAHCTNEEAEILEYIGMEMVRVIDCPVVAEQRRLENEE